MSDDLGLVPVAWRCEEIVGGGDWIYSDKPHTGYEPVYDRAAIERLVAERDEAAAKQASQAELTGRLVANAFSEIIAEIEERASAAESQRDKLKTALTRQTENMAFVINHATLYDWADKFAAELEEDRQSLKATP